MWTLVNISVIEHMSGIFDPLQSTVVVLFRNMNKYYDKIINLSDDLAPVQMNF